MPNLEELKKLDLNKLLEIARERKDLLAQASVAVLSAIVLIGLITSPQGQEYRQQIQALTAKIAVVKSYEDGARELKLFMEALPKRLNTEQISAQITDYAAQNNISILSFAPQPERQEGVSEVLPVQMNVHADAYADILTFFKAMEGSPFSLRVDSCILSNKEGKGIDAQMEISSVGVKI